MATKNASSKDILSNVLVDKIIAPDPQDRVIVHKHKIVYGPDGSYTDVTTLTPFPVTSDASSANPTLFSSGQRTTIPNGGFNLIELINPDTLRNFSSVRVSCRSESKIVVLDDGNMIASGRTGPASPNYFDSFSLSLTPGASLVVSISTCANTAPTDVEAYLIVIDQ